MSREARVHSCSVSYGIPLYACTQRVRTLLSVGVWLLYSWGLYILAHVAWRTWTEVSAEWLPGSRTAVSECVRLDLMRNVRVLSKVTTAASRGVSRAPGLLKAQCRLRFSFSPVEWVRMGSLGFNLRFPDD